jgi:hypothetical protein
MHSCSRPSTSSHQYVVLPDPGDPTCGGCKRVERSGDQMRCSNGTMFMVLYCELHFRHCEAGPAMLTTICPNGMLPSTAAAAPAAIRRLVPLPRR